MKSLLSTALKFVDMAGARAGPILDPGSFVRLLRLFISIPSLPSVEDLVPEWLHKKPWHGLETLSSGLEPREETSFKPFDHWKANKDIKKEEKKHFIDQIRF